MYVQNGDPEFRTDIKDWSLEKENYKRVFKNKVLGLILEVKKQNRTAHPTKKPLSLWEECPSFHIKLFALLLILAPTVIRMLHGMNLNEKNDKNI